LSRPESSQRTRPIGSRVPSCERHIAAPFSFFDLSDTDAMDA